MKIGAEERAVPAAIDAGEDLVHLKGAEKIGEGALVGYIADVIQGVGGVGRPVQQGDGTAVRADQSQDAFDGGGFSGAVFADESHHGAAGHRKGYVGQMEGVILLVQTGDGQYGMGRHTISS